MKLNRNLKNIISLFSVEFISRLLGFIAISYLARVLGKENFGVINIGLAVLSYAMIIGNSGLSLLGTRKIAANIEGAESFTGNILLSRIIISIFIYFFSAAVVIIFVSSKEIIEIILVYNLFLLPSAFLLEWFFHGYQKMETIASGRIIGMAGYLTFLLIFVRESGDTILTGIAWVLGGGLNTLFLIWVFKKHNYFIKFNLKDLKFLSLLKESFSLGAASIIAQFVAMFPIIYIGIVLTSSEAGLYSAAYKIIILFLVFDRVFNSLFFPKIIKSFKETPEKLEEIFNRILKIISVLSLSSAMLAVISGDFIIALVFGSSFAQASIVFQVLIGVFVITLINSVFTYTFIAMNKENIFTWAIFWGMVIFLISTIVLINYIGILAPAAGLVLFELTSLILMSFKLMKEININFYRNILLPALGAILFMGILLSFNLMLPAQLLISIIIGFPVIALLGGINLNEIRFIKKVFV